MLVTIDQTVADIIAICDDDGSADFQFEDDRLGKTSRKVGNDGVSLEIKKKRKRKEKPEPTVCKICNRTFTTRRGYNRHKAIHPKSVRAAKGMEPFSDEEDAMDMAA
jgi:hypothetical protein